MDMQTLRYVTGHYERLQGLRLVPLGVVFLISAAWRVRWLAWWPHTAGEGAAQWFVALMAVAIVASFPIRSWYRRRFGIVRPRPFQAGALPLIAFTGVLVLLVWTEESLHLDVPLARWFLVAGLVLIGVAFRRVRAHYLVIAAACVFVPWWLGNVDMPLSDREAWLDVMVGMALLLAGLGDHLVLIRALGPSLESHGRSV
jgi:hypothetical protein